MVSQLRRTVKNYELMKQHITDAVDELIKSGAKPEATAIDIEKAMEFMYNHSELHQVGPYIISYVVDTPWFSNDPVLVELLVLRVGEGGSFKQVIDFFEQRARHHGCPRICTGTMLAIKDSSLAALYARHGFHMGAMAMTKELG